MKKIKIENLVDNNVKKKKIHLFQINLYLFYSRYFIFSNKKIIYIIYKLGKTSILI